MGMKRRRFLALGSMTCLALVACQLGDDNGNGDSAHELDAAARLHHIAIGLSGVSGLGRAWLEEVPEENLVERILIDIGLNPDSEVDAQTLSRLLNELVEIELKQGVNFEYGGWWLAHTEARLAALHVTLLGGDTSESMPTQFEDADIGSLVIVHDFAPRQMTQGQTLSHHTLPDNVFWFAAPAATPHIRVMIAGYQLTPTFQDSGFSVSVSSDLIGELDGSLGDVEIWLWDPTRRVRQHVGNLTVVPPIKDGPCPSDNWGPRSARLGQVFNEQPDGSAAFWVSMPASPPDVLLVFNGEQLPTRVGEKVVTASVSDASLYHLPGSYSLEILDPSSGQSCEVGQFTVFDD
jgi:hypothetical protein